MPADDWPSFHCRPSTARTGLPFSFSMRQIPTTLTREVGSAPTVSFAKSSFTGSAAAANVASPTPNASATARHVRSLSIAMAVLLRLLQDEYGIDARRPAHQKPAHEDQERQRAEEPGQRRSGAGGQRIARVVVARRSRGRRQIGEAVDERQDLARARRAAHVASRAVGVFDLAITLVVA